MVSEQLARPEGAMRGGVRDPRVLEAMAGIARHEFVPREGAGEAYCDRALPIGHGQTISQPFMVGIMTELLRTRPGDVVLEVGTGSGYQAAVLSRVVGRVYSVERVPELARTAAERLHRLGFRNVLIRCGDGSLGWPEAAPFDGIIVTAAGSGVPPALVDQLKPGARLVIPYGPDPDSQQLHIIEKDDRGEISDRAVMGVRFVPLVEGMPGQGI